MNSFKMNDVWHFLKEFESKEIVKRFIAKKYNYSLNSSKALEINSAFIQGREYFFSSQKADISVRPLLQYYGVVSLSRALILILDKNARENNIIPSHGLKINNWSEICKTGKIEDIVLKSSNGTFTELIRVTNNRSYFRAGTNVVNWRVTYDMPVAQVKFNFKEVAFCFPDLKQSVKAWLDVDVPTRLLNKFNLKDNACELEIAGKYDKSVFSQMFPPSYFEELEITETSNSCIVKFSGRQTPNLCQQWISTFQILGDPYVVPPFKNGFFLNDIATMYSSSFVLGTISRYYPSAWNNINKGINNDSVLPFAINYMDFIQEKFPQVVMDFIESPYSFETA